jgi:peptidyl-prolyl cis-trans isomerase D
MRKASSNWLGRIVMAVVLGTIAVSFAIWGIGDIFRGFGRSTVAKIGSTEITIEQFRQIYNDRLQQFSRQLGRPVTPELARQYRLDQQIVGQLVAEAALDQTARKMRLNLSDNEVARQIMNDATFKGAGGQFDRARFEQIIRQAGYTEPRFAAEQKRLTLRREIAEAVGGDPALPKTMTDAVNRYENEQRAIDYVTLDRSKAGDIEAPTPEVLTKYFEDNKVLFRAPEYRGVTYLAVTPAALAKPNEVSDDDAKRYYDANINRYGTPERRTLQQISFPNAEQAQAAAARLNAEFSFEALAKERGLSEKDIDLGTLTKAGIIDRAVAEAAFALKEGETSAPVKGTFATVLIKVVKIEPAQIKPLAEVQAEIKQALAVDRAKATLADLHDKIEDERAGGAKLSEIGQKLGLTAPVIEAMDREGRDPAGASIANLPAGVDLAAQAFGSGVGVDNEPVRLSDGGYVWFDVTKVTPARDRTLDEVRARVEERWRADQIAQRLKAKADEMVEKLKSGTSINDLGTAEALPVKTSFGIKRGRNTATVSQQLADAVFLTPKDGAGSAEGGVDERVVFRVTDITVPAFNALSNDGKQIDQTMRRSLSEDIIAQYVQRIQADLGTTINQNALRQVSSGGSIDPNDQN